MKKIFILLLLFVSSIFANDVYTFEVDSTEMVDVYFNIFNAIAMIFGSSGYIDILRMVFLFGGFIVFAGGVLRGLGSGEGGVGTIKTYATYTLAGFAALSLVFSTKASISITSQQAGSYCSASSSPTTGVVVDNIPAPLAYTFAFVNKSGLYLTNLAESAFTVPSANGTTAMKDNDGMLGAIATATNILYFDTNDIAMHSKDGNKFNFNEAMKTLYSECIFIPFSQKSDGQQQISNLLGSTDIEGYFNNLYSGSTTVGGIDAGDYTATYYGDTYSCRGLYESVIKPKLDQYKPELACMVGGTAGAMQVITHQNDVPESNYQQTLIQAGMLTALSQAGTNLGVGVSGMDYAAGKTKADFYQNSVSNAAYTGQSVGILQGVLRAILYGAFPFIFIVVMMPGGYKVVKQYLESLVWVESWGPMAAIVNMFVVHKAETQIGKNIYEKNGGMDITNVSQMISTSASISAMGSYLYISIPALSWLILRGSAQMMGNVFGAIGAKLASNLDTAQINKDASDMAKVGEINKERAKRGEKAISFAEAQHYESTLGGVKQGASFDTEMSYGSNTIGRKARTAVKTDFETFLKSSSQAGGDDNLVDIKADNAKYQTSTEKGTSDYVKDPTTNLSNVSNTTKLKNQVDNTTLLTEKASVENAGGDYLSLKNMQSFVKGGTDQKNLNETLSVLSTPEKFASLEDAIDLERKNTGLQKTKEKVTTENIDNTEQGKITKLDTVNQTVPADNLTPEQRANALKFDINNVEKPKAQMTETYTPGEFQDIGFKNLDYKFNNDKGQFDRFGKTYENQGYQNGMITANNVLIGNQSSDLNNDGKVDPSDLNKIQKQNVNENKDNFAGTDAKQNKKQKEAHALREYAKNDKELADFISNSDKKWKNYSQKEKDERLVSAFNEDAELRQKVFTNGSNNKTLDVFKENNVTPKEHGRHKALQETQDIRTKEEQTKTLVDAFPKIVSNLEHKKDEAMKKIAQQHPEMSKKEVAAAADQYAQTLLANSYLYDENTTKQAVASTREALNNKGNEMAKMYAMNNLSDKDKKALEDYQNYEKTEHKWMANMMTDVDKMKKDADKAMEHYNSLKQNYFKTDAGKNVQHNLQKSMDNYVNHLEKTGAISRDNKGNISYASSGKALSRMNQDQQMKFFTQWQASAGGRQLNTVDAEGMKTEFVKAINGDFTSYNRQATYGYHKNADFGIDVGYKLTHDDYVSPEHYAVATTSYNTAKETINDINTIKSLIQPFKK